MDWKPVGNRQMLNIELVAFFFLFKIFDDFVFAFPFLVTVFSSDLFFLRGGGVIDFLYLLSVICFCLYFSPTFIVLFFICFNLRLSQSFFYLFLIVWFFELFFYLEIFLPVKILLLLLFICILFLYQILSASSNFFFSDSFHYNYFYYLILVHFPCLFLVLKSLFVSVLLFYLHSN